MATSEFEFVQGIKKRLLALNEIYQAVPFPGFSELPARRGCKDRISMIEHLVPPDGRVLDLGSNLGYYCFRLAQMKNAQCHGVECVPETYQICQDLKNYYGVEKASFHNVRVSADLILNQPSFDVILSLAVLHHVLRDEGLEVVEDILRAIRERCTHLVLELPAPEEDGWKAGKQVAFPNPILPWLADLGFFPAEALHVRSHMGTDRPFIHLKPCITKTGDERYGAELAGWSGANGVPGIPVFYTHYESKKLIYTQYIAGPLLDTQKIEHKQPGDVWRELARTLTGLHDRDIVHGDVRSWNVILHPDRAYLIDFGLSILKGYGPTSYQSEIYKDLSNQKDWDWLGLAAMKWYADEGRTQPKHPYDWLPSMIEENQIDAVAEAKSWAKK